MVHAPGDIVAQLYRNHFGQMVSSLVSYFGLENLSLAEDLVQDTFVAALEEWKLRGIPDDPLGWLYRVCKNRTINRLRKLSTKVAGDSALADAADDPKLDQVFLDHEIRDSQLRILFAFCHPALPPKSQIVMILRSCGGLTVSEIGSALGMSEDAVTKAITRGRQTLASQKETIAVPFLLHSQERLHTVHTAVYLLFSEGYFSESDEAVRKGLCLEAMRLMKAIIDIPGVRTADSFALLALMCFHTARFDARIGADGDWIELERQDRSRWDRELISLGASYLHTALKSRTISRFVVEACIASVHCRAVAFQETDWHAIVKLYKRLEGFQSSPFLDLNRAVAVYFAEGGKAATDLLAASRHKAWLERYFLYHIFLARVCETGGDRPGAKAHYERAQSLTSSQAAGRFIGRKLAQLK